MPHCLNYYPIRKRTKEVGCQSYYIKIQSLNAGRCNHITFPIIQPQLTQRRTQHCSSAGDYAKQQSTLLHLVNTKMMLVVYITHVWLDVKENACVSIGSGERKMTIAPTHTAALLHGRFINIQIHTIPSILYNGLIA